jgi:hypothetical protein
MCALLSLARSSFVGHYLSQKRLCLAFAFQL